MQLHLLFFDEKDKKINVLQQNVHENSLHAATEQYTHLQSGMFVVDSEEWPKLDSVALKDMYDIMPNFAVTKLLVA